MMFPMPNICQPVKEILNEFISKEAEYIYAPLEIKIQRLISRDRVSREEITAKMNAQWSDTKKMTLTRFHILNDEKTPLLEQIEKVLEKLN